MKKVIYDMIVDYSCCKFPAMKKDFEKFNGILTEEIKQGIENFKSFTTYDNKKDIIFMLLCDDSSMQIKCETKKYLITFYVNTLNQNKLRRLRKNKNESCNVVCFSIENKSNNQTTCYTININRINYEEFNFTRLKEVYDSVTLTEISSKENNDITICYEELENIFATATSLEIRAF